MKEVYDLVEAQTLALAIVDTLPEPFLVLDETLCLLAGSRCFYEIFKEDPANARGRSLFELSNGQWDIPGLRQLLATVIPQHAAVEGFEFEQDFAHLGKRTIQLNAHPIRDESLSSRTVLLAIRDITERREAEQEKQRLLEHTEELLEQQKTLLREMQHRIANSLQIIASILLLKAQTVQSDETRQHLQDAHERVMAVATVQEQLHPTPFGAAIEVRTYLTRLCDSLAASMVLDGQPVSLRVDAGEGTVTSEQAVSMGLIATELVINALKHAFPDGAKGEILVGFESSARAWRLAVSDDGVGISRPLPETPVKIGLGTSIVEALTRQLGGRVTTSAASPGTTVSVTVPSAA